MKTSILFLIISAIASCLGVLLTAFFWNPEMVFVPILVTLAIGFIAAFIKIKKEGKTSEDLWCFLFTLFGSVGGSILALIIWFIIKG